MKRIMHTKYLKEKDINEKLEFITSHQNKLYGFIAEDNQLFAYIDSITKKDNGWPSSPKEILFKMQNKKQNWTSKNYIMKIV